MRELMRVCRFTPLNDGRSFVLRMFDRGDDKRASTGQYLIAYEFAETAPSGEEETIFSGEDYGCSPIHAINSDESVCGLMGFLTLRPGDTDKDYFENYSDRQRAWTEDYACEVISCDVSIYEEAIGASNAQLAEDEQLSAALEHGAWEDCEVSE